MKDLFVSSQSRGKGIGLELIKYLANIAVSHDYLRLNWTAESTNPLAGKFYTSIIAHFVYEKEYYRFDE